MKRPTKLVGAVASHTSPRTGFTLVELLVAIAIIGILAGLAFYSLLGAQVDARNARTRGTIQKLNEIILQRWEEYRYRPVDLRLDVPAASPGGLVDLDGLIGASSVSPVSPIELARGRMVVLRDTMRMELPDRVTDIIYGPTQYTIAFTGPSGASAAKIARSVPSRYGTLYKALYNQIVGLKANPEFAANWAALNLVDIDSTSHPMSTGTLAPLEGVLLLTSNTPEEWRAAVQSSELLYLIVANSNYSGTSALEFFGASEVGDPDGDGLLEFVDAWGQSIHWIRWPAGYPGDLVRYADDDAMDPLKSDWRYRSLPPPNAIPEDWKTRTLVPLIASSGNDGQFGITFDFTTPIAYATMTWPASPAPFGTTGPHYAAGPYYYPDPNATWDFANGGMNTPNSEMPYVGTNVAGYRANQIGSVPTFTGTGDRNVFADDNITNHDLILEP